MNNTVDIAVIGGGPAGLLAAYTAAEYGHEVHLFERRNSIGFYEHCAGLLSVEGLKRLGLSNLPNEIIQNRHIRGALLFSPSNKELLVSKDAVHAWVINRQKFDQYLGSLAEKKGVQIHLSNKVNHLIRDKNNNSLKLLTSHGDLYSKIAILAEGRFPTISKQMGLSVPDRRNIILASQHILSNFRDLDPEYVELYLSREYSAGFFAWVIPINENTAKIGLASRLSHPGVLLKRFIRKHPIIKPRASTATVLKRMSGAIPLGGPIKRTYTDNILVVGDAAGHTKPTTGGGVVLGGIAAKIAGSVAADAISKNIFSRKFLRIYEKLWKKEFFFSIKLMRLIRLYLDSLDDAALDRLFGILLSPKIKKKFTTMGHIDWQHKLALSLLSNLRFDLFIISTLPQFLFYLIKML